MPDVTVCIPAYRSEAFIHHTLRSVLAQTNADFVVDIAVEPPAGDTNAGRERALAAVDADPHRWEALAHLSRLQLGAGVARPTRSIV